MLFEVIGVAPVGSAPCVNLRVTECGVSFVIRTEAFFLAGGVTFFALVVCADRMLTAQTIAMDDGDAGARSPGQQRAFHSFGVISSPVT